MSIYYRQKPCRKCGSHDFYLAGFRCYRCLQEWKANNAARIKAGSEKWKQENREKLRTAQQRWAKNNRDYLRVYNRARYEKRKECA